MKTRPCTRSEQMRHIKSQDTSIELVLRKRLWHMGYRYRKNYKGLPGSPDIVLTKYRIAIFCDSEFFHGKDWNILEQRLKKGSNASFWIAKIQRNMERDDLVNKELRAKDWIVLRFWGDDISKHLDECVRTVEEAIFEYRTSN